MMTEVILTFKRTHGADISNKKQLTLKPIDSTISIQNVRNDEDLLNKQSLPIDFDILEILHTKTILVDSL